MEFVTIGAASHPGLKREDNQDSYDYYLPEDDSVHTKGILMTVADGMGGHAAGAMASRLAVDVLMTEYYNAEHPSISESLKNAFLKANQEVLAKSQDDGDMQGMGTTMTAVVLKEAKMYFAHVGDSRGYIIFKNKMSQFTRDHSYVDSLVKAGAISEEEALTHPDRNAITRAIGIRSELIVDVSKKHLKVKNGQYVLLCSDGLYKVVSNEEILSAVYEYQAPNVICEKLIEKANENGGPDNVTVILAMIGRENKKESLIHRVMDLVR